MTTLSRIDAQNVGIGTTTPHTSARLQVSDSARGLLIPRLSKKQRNNILNAAQGLLVYQMDSISGFYYYTGSTWRKLLDTLYTDSSLAGIGTVTNPLRIARQGADTGQVLKWNGQRWSVGQDSIGVDTLFTTARFTGSGSSGNPLDLAQQGADTGQVLVWDGAAWAPADKGQKWGGEQYTTCKAIYDSGAAIGDGIYTINPDGPGGAAPIEVFCNMEKGGYTQLWLIPDHRDSVTVNFDSDGQCNWSISPTTWSRFPNGYFTKDFKCSGPPWSYHANDDTQSYQLTYYDAAGNHIASSHKAALSKQVERTVFDGWHYGSDSDAPCGVDGIGPYGQDPTLGTQTNGGGGAVLYFSDTAAIASGTDLVLCDADNPDNATTPEVSMKQLAHRLDWTVLKNGLVTHIGVQDVCSDETSSIVWDTRCQSGGSQAMLDPPYFWVQ